MNSKNSIFFLNFISIMLLNFTLTTNNHIQDPELIKVSNHYKKIIQKWNVTSWQYGPMYKTSDRKALIDAVLKDIREHKISAEPEAVTILNHIASDYEDKPEYHTLVQDVKNYIQTTSQNINQLDIHRYIDEIDIILNESQRFWHGNWHHMTKLFDANTSNISENYYTTLQEACRIGDQLQEYNLLEIFDTQYNMLNALVDNLQQINNKRSTLLSDLKNKTKSYMHTLPEITISKHKSFEPQTENILRLHKPTPIQHNRRTQILQIYKSIQDVRGEGNCGYRAFLGSVLMNSFDHKNFAGVQRLQTLVREKFIPLFTKYANNQTGQYKLSVPITRMQNKIVNVTEEELQSIQRSMMLFLDAIQTYHSDNQIETLFNAHPAFDFFMIMFLRALIADELLKPEQDTAKMVAMSARDEDETTYFTNLLRWTTWIDQPEFDILNQITGIDIHLINEQPTGYFPTDYSSQTPSHGKADILFVHNNHYQIIRSKK